GAVRILLARGLQTVGTRGWTHALVIEYAVSIGGIYPRTIAIAPAAAVLVASAARARGGAGRPRAGRSPGGPHARRCTAAVRAGLGAGRCARRPGASTTVFAGRGVALPGRLCGHGVAARGEDCHCAEQEEVSHGVVSIRCVVEAPKAADVPAQEVAFSRRIR